MKLSSAPAGLSKGSALPVSERKIVGNWLSTRLSFYHQKVGKNQRSPGQQAVEKLMQSGLSPLKRRYQKTGVSAYAVAWGWLGREKLLRRIDSSVFRPKQGGTAQQGWLWSAMIEGGWLTSTPHYIEKQRQERLVSCLPRCAGATMTNSSWCLGSHCLTSLHQMLRRHYPLGPLGVDLLALDVAALVIKGILTGDCLRYRSGGNLDTAWWCRLLAGIAENDLPVSSETVLSLEATVKQWYYEAPSIPPVIPKAQETERTLWVLDLCCGFRSLDEPVRAVLTPLAGIDTRVLCIGLDICPRQIRCSEYIEPDICSDLLDDEAMPPGSIVESVSIQVGLDLQDLVHVHASPPCTTNSRADASNLNRGCGYRNWRSAHCKPLHSSTSSTTPNGYTTVQHRQLAVEHDRLERKLFSSLLTESSKHHFTFTVENPVGTSVIRPRLTLTQLGSGAMARKLHVQRLMDSGLLHRATVDHCNFTPADELSYAKATDYFNNFDWHPTGASGDGRCGRNGRRTGVKCTHGWQNEVTGRWKHHNTIAQESHNEISGEGYHRKASKNHLPLAECTAFLQVAAELWSYRQT